MIEKYSNINTSLPCSIQGLDNSDINTALKLAIEKKFKNKLELMFGITSNEIKEEQINSIQRDIIHLFLINGKPVTRSDITQYISIITKWCPSLHERQFLEISTSDIGSLIQLVLVRGDYGYLQCRIF